MLLAHLKYTSPYITLITILVTALSVLCPQNARAAFIQNYDINNFTLTNTNGDGGAFTPDAGLTLVITGPNNGSGLPGTTDITIGSFGTGLVQFQYSYSSLDFPGFDYAGYLLGGQFMQFADTDGQSAILVLPVTIGQSFGFRVGSLDNTGEPGILTISDFNAPVDGSVPEPATFSMLLIAGGLAGVSHLRRKHGRKGY